MSLSQGFVAASLTRAATAVAGAVATEATCCVGELLLAVELRRRKSVLRLDIPARWSSGVKSAAGGGMSLALVAAFS
ncbi:hypothetical protein [Nevskia ramosa]|uniref:hypothetical protein n=1 Tax=Nevskia ramosa TaxID=64002 RepID=UPI0003B3DF32|nr:hypothetical protein [Nevskia ramosa]